MAAKNYKYVVLTEVCEIDCSTLQSSNSIFEEFVFRGSDALAVRLEALAKAHEMLNSFIAEKQNPELPMLPMGTLPEAENIMNCRNYKVTVDFVNGNHDYSIYNSGEWEHNEDMEDMIEGLLKEYSVLLKYGIDLSDCTRTVNYHDYVQKRDISITIADNGISWEGASVGFIEDLGIWEEH